MILKRQLQLIKQRFGVGLSLFLFLANQIAAQASTCSDKTKWLTSNLEKQASSNNDRSLMTLKPLSAKADYSRETSSIVVDYSDNPSRKTKLRPFMANRKLPSRRDLELALIEQQAKLAQERDTRLIGQVSTSIGSPDNSPSYTKPYIANNSKHTTTTPTDNTPAQFADISQYYTKPLVTISAQTGFSLMKQAEQHLLSTTKQPIMQSDAYAANSGTEQETTSSITALPANLEIIKNTSNNNSNNETTSTPALDWTAEQSGPSAFSLPTIGSNNQSQVSSLGFGPAGPPPFPLNLLPEASLKQLLKSLARSRSSNSINGPSVAFGSWHSPYPMAGSPSNRPNNLPYGGFQSHLIKNYPSSGRKTNYHHASALPAVTSSHKKSIVSKQKTQATTNNKAASLRNKVLPESQVRVATYPAYATQSLRPWNFAQ